MSKLNQKIAHLKAVVSMTDLAQDKYGLVLEGRKNILCPFHAEKIPSFSFFYKNGNWGFTCFSAKCGLKGDIIDFVGLMEFGKSWSRKGVQFSQALNLLEEFAGGSFTITDPPTKSSPPPFPASPTVTPKIQEIWDLTLSICGELLLEQPRVMQYLFERGFDQQVIKKWRFGFWPRKEEQFSRVINALKVFGYTQAHLQEARLLLEGKWGLYEPFGGSVASSGRIISADVDHIGAAKALLARVLPWENELKSAKYLYLADFEKPLFGLDRIGRSNGPVLLTEGVWNMYTLHKWGYDAVAPGGTHLSAAQRQPLLKFKRPVVPIPDLDPIDQSGQSPGMLALARWQKELPEMKEALLLPSTVEGKLIKDVNDLEQIPNGQGLFTRLAAKHGVLPRKAKS